MQPGELGQRRIEVPGERGGVVGVEVASADSGRGPGRSNEAGSQALGPLGDMAGCGLHGPDVPAAVGRPARSPRSRGAGRCRLGRRQPSPAAARTPMCDRQVDAATGRCCRSRSGWRHAWLRCSQPGRPAHPRHAPRPQPRRRPRTSATPRRTAIASGQPPHQPRDTSSRPFPTRRRSGGRLSSVTIWTCSAGPRPPPAIAHAEAVGFGREFWPRLCARSERTPVEAALEMCASFSCTTMLKLLLLTSGGEHLHRTGAAKRPRPSPGPGHVSPTWLVRLRDG